MSQLALTLGNQRWNGGRASYRKPTEPIRTSEYEVAEIADDTTPKTFVITHHYAASFPSARFRFGLYHFGRLEGVAVFSHPCSDKVLTNVFPGVARDSVELGRFVLLDEVPGNAETWMLARCFDLLRGRIRGIVSFSDDQARTDIAGKVVFPGHLGTIYQAHNARYLGRGEAQILNLLPDGSVFNKRNKSKVRGREKGWQYAAALLEAAGAKPLSATEDSARWLDRWLPKVTRSFRHPGNHKYAWGRTREAQRVLPAGLPYPKRLPN